MAASLHEDIARRQRAAGVEDVGQSRSAIEGLFTVQADWLRSVKISGVCWLAFAFSFFCLLRLSLMRSSPRSSLFTARDQRCRSFVKPGHLWPLGDRMRCVCCFATSSTCFMGRLRTAPSPGRIWPLRRSTAGRGSLSCLLLAPSVSNQPQASLTRSHCQPTFEWSLD